MHNWFAIAGLVVGGALAGDVAYAQSSSPALQLEIVEFTVEPSQTGDYYIEATYDSFFLTNQGSEIRGGRPLVVDRVPVRGTSDEGAWTFYELVGPNLPNVVDVSIQLVRNELLIPDTVIDLDPSTTSTSIDLVVDLDTGTWTGDVNFPDNCLMGPLGGEVCFDLNLDSDQDTLLDDWEINGFDADGDGVVDVPLHTMGADPDKRDLFLEIDCFVDDVNGDGTISGRGEHTQCPMMGAIEDVVQAFADADVSNPDGSRGIQLHIDTGPLYGAGVVTTVTTLERPGEAGVTGSFGDLGGGNTIPEAGNSVIQAFGSSNPGTPLSSLQSANFDADRTKIFHYGVFGNQTNARQASFDCTSGQANGIPGSAFFVTLGGQFDDDGDGMGDGPCWAADANGFSVGSRADQAGTLMHEYGHVLGLGHGGTDSVNFKPNYLSVMNYSFQSCSIVAQGFVKGGCDFSGIKLRDLDETGLDECFGLTPVLGPMDWNGDNDFDGQTCPADPSDPDNNTNVAADVNQEWCVEGESPLSTMAVGDDRVVGTNIADGPDLVCNSTAAMSDEQKRPVGSVNPTTDLEGAEDWLQLVYSPVTVVGRPDGVTFGASGSGLEATPEILQNARDSLGEQLAPLPTAQIAFDGSVEPGEELRYTVTFRNDGGRGPAFGTGLRRTLDGVSLPDLPGLPLPVGDEDERNLGFDVPDDACPGASGTIALDYVDFANRPFTLETVVTLPILDVTGPVFGPLPAAVPVSSCDSSVFVPLPTPSATDPCGGVTVTGAVIRNNGATVDVPVVGGANLPVGEHLVEWTAIDDSGNTSVVTQTVVVSPSIAALNSLKFADRASTSAFVASYGTTEIGADARTGSLVSAGNVFLRNRALVDGDLTSGGSVTLQAQAAVSGSTSQQATVSLPALAPALAGVAPGTGSIVVNAGQTLALPPGAYGRIIVNSQGALVLQAGDYGFRDLIVNSAASLTVTPDTDVRVGQGFTLRGGLVGGPFDLAMAGSGQITFESPFEGTVTAPLGTVSFRGNGSPTHRGRFVARNLRLEPSATLVCE